MVEIHQRSRTLANRRGSLPDPGEPSGHKYVTRRTHTGLSEGELRVLTLAAQGLTDRQIGGKLGIVTRTVKTHLEHIATKSGTVGKLEAVQNALDTGELTLRSVTTGYDMEHVREGIDSLTPAERSIFDLVGTNDGFSSSARDIASVLHLSERTIRTHLGSIYSKLGLVSDLQRIQIAVLSRYVNDGSDESQGGISHAELNRLGLAGGKGRWESTADVLRCAGCPLADAPFILHRAMVCTHLDPTVVVDRVGNLDEHGGLRPVGFSSNDGDRVKGGILAGIVYELSSRVRKAISPISPLEGCQYRRGIRSISSQIPQQRAG